MSVTKISILEVAKELGYSLNPYIDKNTPDDYRTGKPEDLRAFISGWLGRDLNKLPLTKEEGRVFYGVSASNSDWYNPITGKCLNKRSSRGIADDISKLVPGTDYNDFYCSTLCTKKGCELLYDLVDYLLKHKWELRYYDTTYGGISYDDNCGNNDDNCSNCGLFFTDLVFSEFKDKFNDVNDIYKFWHDLNQFKLSLEGEREFTLNNHSFYSHMKFTHAVRLAGHEYYFHMHDVDLDYDGIDDVIDKFDKKYIALELNLMISTIPWGEDEFPKSVSEIYDSIEEFENTVIEAKNKLKQEYFDRIREAAKALQSNIKIDDGALKVDYDSSSFDLDIPFCLFINK